TRDRRTRHAAVLEQGERRVLIDTPPELRLQLVREDIGQVDAVWYTHHHADHTHGVDDLRVFSMRTGAPLAVYASRECRDVLEAKFDYVFNSMIQPVEGTF